ncbi:MAG: FxsA family protein [Amylibacter sp.]
MPLLLIFVAIPIIEIALFIQVGGWLGLWPTLAIVVLTAVIGTYLLRLQGMAELAKLQGSMSSGQSPVGPIANGALILVAGVLLLTPGFFTDAVGFALLTPPVRAVVIKWATAKFAGRSNVDFTHPHQTQARDSGAVDGDYVVLDDDEPSRPGNSGWTKRD